jgi:nucleoid DNA-binding protein
MRKRELVVKIAEQTGIKQIDVNKCIQKFFELAMEALISGERLEFRDFGVFKVVKRMPKVGRNPKNPQQVVQIPERKVVVFKQGKMMKQKMEEASVI